MRNGSLGRDRRLEQPRTARKVSAVEIVRLRLDDVRYQLELPAIASRRRIVVSGEGIEEFLAIVDASEQLLALFQFADELARIPQPMIRENRS